MASRLGNTLAICRKCYAHPAIVGAYLDGSLVRSLQCEIEVELCEELAWLASEEVAVVLLQQRLRRVAETT